MDMDRIESIIGQMTLKEKVSLCTGKNFWETKGFENHNIPSIFMCDGPLGLRKQKDQADMLGVNESYPATCFPAEVTTSATWDTELLAQLGKAFSEEAHDQKTDIVLGPGANIKRNPLCGRNFEYFSEDPYVSGKLASSFIRGLEEGGTASCLKHFAVNSQEHSRFSSNGIIDDRTLREIYLTAFEIAVKEGRPSSVMCSYPKLNGVHCSDHKELLTDILRDQWGFDGAVITDWGAMNDRIEGFRAGCDLNMPGGSSYMENDVIKAVKEGRLSESDIDNSVRRLLKLAFKAVENRRPGYKCDYNEHNDLARKAAEQGTVLLKNDDGILPLQEDCDIAILGAMASTMRYQGAGSSHINPTRITNPLDILENKPYAPGYDEKGNTTDSLINEAVELAKKAKVALVFAGLPPFYESEGFDRSSLDMSAGHNRLIEEVSRVNENTVVVLFSGSVVHTPWADKVKSILFMGLPGQAGGEACYNLLYGKVNPSGKLTESWVYDYNDVPSSEIFGKTKDALYEEGIYVGYRYYDKAKVKVRWPFGYGLSYTTFSFSDLVVNDKNVSVTVTNTGKIAGAEVVQLYVCNKDCAVHRPVRELKGFRKVYLEKGQSMRVDFTLTERDFSIWDGCWVVPKASYSVQIGNLESPIQVQGQDVEPKSYQKGSFYENCTGKPCLKDLESAMLRKYEAPVLKKGEFTMDNSVMEMRPYSLMMKIMYKAVEGVIAKGFGGKRDYENSEFRMLMESSAGAPLRSMGISGGMPDSVMQGLLCMANGHFFKGIFRMLKK